MILNKIKSNVLMKLGCSPALFLSKRPFLKTQKKKKKINKEETSKRKQFKLNFICWSRVREWLQVQLS